MFVLIKVLLHKMEGMYKQTQNKSCARGGYNKIVWGFPKYAAPLHGNIMDVYQIQDICNVGLTHYGYLGL